jgi:CubicO group peptidase (beta-lactamase class C family)
MKRTAISLATRSLIQFAPILLAITILFGCAPLQTRDDGRTYAVSTARLKQLSVLTAADVQKGQLPGVVMLVARNGTVVYSDAIGVQDPKTGTPMQADSIFRIASMTKPLVTVGALTLVEDGRIQLADPVSKYLPELKGLQVGVEKQDASGKASLELVPAQREMTVQDLLRQTSGLTYGFFGKSLVKDEYNKAGLFNPEQSNAELVTKLSKLPLAFQPGTTWDYSMATDVLGALIERVSGQTLDIFLAERVTKPLGMKDTGFWADPAQQSRIAEPFALDPDTKAPARVPDVRKPRRFLSGGGGMVSTAPDYLRFTQMLLNGGELDGVRILSRKTVELMTSDQLGLAIVHGPLYFPGPGYGFGFGVRVRIAPGEALNLGSVGDYGWEGVYGTAFFVDPKERLIAIWMMQRTNLPVNIYFWRRMRAIVYTAIE